MYSALYRTPKTETHKLSWMYWRERYIATYVWRARRSRATRGAMLGYRAQTRSPDERRPPSRYFALESPWTSTLSKAQLPRQHRSWLMFSVALYIGYQSQVSSLSPLAHTLTLSYNLLRFFSMSINTVIFIQSPPIPLTWLCPTARSDATQVHNASQKRSFLSLPLGGERSRASLTVEAPRPAILVSAEGVEAMGWEFMDTYIVFTSEWIAKSLKNFFFGIPRVSHNAAWWFGCHTLSETNYASIFLSYGTMAVKAEEMIETGVICRQRRRNVSRQRV